MLQATGRKRAMGSLSSVSLLNMMKELSRLQCDRVSVDKNIFGITTKLAYCHLVKSIYCRLSEKAECANKSKIRYMESDGEACIEGKGGDPTVTTKGSEANILRV